MSFALDKEIITANPASGITKKLQLRKIEMEPLTGEEVSTFQATCSTHITRTTTLFSSQPLELA